ncbi:MAG TPA: hypothetical protein VFF78_01730 [Anaerolineaceae bacterium]|nr:hypothetical protein [Anaerolineaceae bacterium]
MTIPPPAKRPSEIAYRRKSFREIWLPMIIALSILGGLGILSIVLMAVPETSDSASKWSHLSTLYLVSILCLCNMVPLVILGGMVYLMTKTPGGVINLGNKLQDKAEQMSSGARKISDKLAEPVISAGSKAASVSRFFRRGQKPKA